MHESPGSVRQTMTGTWWAGCGAVVCRRQWRTGARAEQVELVGSLRAAGRSWPQVAEALRGRYRLGTLAAFRVAHNLTQDQVAQLWCRRWPDDPKTNKTISYWENWPASSGREPSLSVLGRLAQLYQCTVADLVAGVGDYSDRDEAVSVQPLWQACPGCGGPVAT